MSTPPDSSLDQSLEGAGTRLLVSIKQLLESIPSWGEGKVDEGHVSDVYVQLGNNFEEAMKAFKKIHIDVSDLLSFPQSLRTVLEQCLSEEASMENVEIYLPDVQRIVVGLLQGLKNKQTAYRKIMASHDA